MMGNCGVNRRTAGARIGPRLSVFIRGLFLLLAGWTSPLAAQLEQITVPKGQLRAEVGGEFDNWDQQFREGTTESWAADFASDSLGSDRIPELATAEGVLGRILGQAGFRLSIGRTTATELVNVGTLNLGLALGLTHRLTIFGRLPLVRARAQPRVAFTGDSVGFNPASRAFGSGTGGSASQTFFDNFAHALDTLTTRFQAGYYAGRPDSVLAAQTLAEGTLLRARLDTLTRIESDNAPFLPVSQSSAGQAINNTVTTLQGTLSTLQVAGFNDVLPLPDTPLGPGEFDQFLSSPSPGPVVVRAPTETLYWYLGNIELGASYSLIDRWDRPGHLGGIRLVGRASLTLPTARLDRSDDFFDVGTGTAGYGLNLGLVADLGSRSWGARLEGDYVRRFPVLRVRRISLPSQPYAYLYREANLSLDQGDDLSLSVQPFYRLTPAFALTADIRHTSRGASHYSYYRSEDALPGLNPDDLAVDSKMSWTSLSGGVTFTSRGVNQTGRGIPVEANWHYGQTVAASGGRVPKLQFTSLSLRLYFSLWH
jgi:hypothetical protein